MAARKAGRRAESKPGSSDIALIASILGNLGQLGANSALRSRIEALQRLILDWQGAYETLNRQLFFAERALEEEKQLTRRLQEDLRRARERASQAEKRFWDGLPKLGAAKKPPAPGQP